jgi:ATP phosphoribosyltransferase regulatory subunit
MRRWLLPEFIDDILPAEARVLERARRALLDHFAAHGYQLVQPPLVEHLESLLTGTGRDLDLRTFKVVDQLSGRLLGVRADITPQVARIDAHLLQREGIVRLCYAGSALHTLPAGSHRSREVLQIGAELYGHAGVESDCEIVGLLLSSLARLAIGGLKLDLGHVGVFRGLAHGAGLAAEAEEELFDALRTKDLPGVSAMTRELPAPWGPALRELPRLYGPPAEVLARAAAALPPQASVSAALESLGTLASRLAATEVDVQLDLADMRGYHYETGVVFAVYTAGHPAAIGLGGRYDDIGRAFGRARPATGFSLDLREVAALLPAGVPEAAILPPAGRDPALAAAVSALREAGEAVIVDLAGTGQAHALGCDRRLESDGGKWRVRPA